MSNRLGARSRSCGAYLVVSSTWPSCPSILMLRLTQGALAIVRIPNRTDIPIISMALHHHKAVEVLILHLGQTQHFGDSSLRSMRMEVDLSASVNCSRHWLTVSMVFCCRLGPLTQQFQEIGQVSYFCLSAWVVLPLCLRNAVVVIFQRVLSLLRT